MRPRLQVSLLIDTPAHAESVRGKVATEAAARPRHGDRFEASPAVEPDEASRGHVVRLDVRYAERADLTSVLARLSAQVYDHPVTGSWVRGVRVTTHLCTHDEAQPGPCSESEHQVVLERGLEVDG